MHRSPDAALRRLAGGLACLLLLGAGFCSAEPPVPGSYLGQLEVVADRAYCHGSGQLTSVPTCGDEVDALLDGAELNVALTSEASGDRAKTSVLVEYSAGALPLVEALELAFIWDLTGSFAPANGPRGPHLSLLGSDEGTRFDFWAEGGANGEAGCICILRKASRSGEPTCGDVFQLSW